MSPLRSPAMIAALANDGLCAVGSLKKPGLTDSVIANDSRHRSAAVPLPPDQIEHGKAVLVSDNGLTIDHERVGRSAVTAAAKRGNRDVKS